MGEGPGGWSGGGGLDPKAESVSEGFSAARRGTIKCNFTAAPQAGKERFFCPFQIKLNFFKSTWRQAATASLDILRTFSQLPYM